ncbi:UNVERIFIED_CONTAM: hypothetical protein GTU68_056292, partial [Idotea baltica]|nr:hypothetical protein [Idotea baltica]
TLPLIWALATLFALPNFLWRHLDTHDLPFPTMPSVSFCFEKWPEPLGRGIYSFFVFFMQFILPLFTVSLAYLQVCKRVRKRMGREKERRHNIRREDQHRVRRTVYLLMSIALAYSASWLPLNLFNLIVDMRQVFASNEHQMIGYAICHILGMSSACSNPFLYGWHNNNFRREFLKHSRFLRFLRKVLPCRFGARLKKASRSVPMKKLDLLDKPLKVQEERETELISVESRVRVKRSTKKGKARMEDPSGLDVVDREVTAISSCNGGCTTTVL